MMPGTNQLILNKAAVQEAVEEYINQKLKPGVNITVTDFAQKDSYDSTYVVDFTDKKANEDDE